MVRALRHVRGQRRRLRGRPEEGFSARKQILDAAAAVFGSKGFSATSVEDILEVAGVSRRTFYRFFQNREQVLTELFDTAGLLLVQAMKSALLLGKTSGERIKYVIEVILRSPHNTGPLALVFHTEAQNPSSPLRARREAIINSIVALLDSEVAADSGVHIDPLVFHSLIAAIEQVSVDIYTKSAATEADLDRGRRVMIYMAERILGESKLAPTRE
jgi:AcrR family transcriptional regulator